MTVSRYYSSVAKRTTLTADAGSSATSMVIAAATGFPSLYPYTMIVDEDTVNEELVTVSARSGTTLTVVRAVDGSAAVAHTAGASVRHGVSARDFADSRSHEDASEAVHGLGAGSAVVGRIDAQTLTNKTLTAPVINAATVTGTVSGGTFSGSTLTSATLGSALAAGAFKITGLADPTNAQDAATKNYADTGMSSQLALATTQATNAATSASGASTSATAAAASAATASTQASNASGSATTSTTQASNASTSAGTATTQATNAATSASGASTSATNAAASAATATTEAGTSTTQAGIATTQATNASTSASTASTQAGVATTQAGIATTQATNSASSASSASGSASAASADASTASSGASTATTQAGISTTQAGISTTQAGVSTTQAGIATTQASNASTSATGAASSASAASADASSASSSAAAAASALDSFDDRYLGAKATAPTLDNDGNALVQGALYYLNTGASEVIGMYVYDGASWIKASAAAVTSVVTYEYTATASQTVFSGADLNSVSMTFTSGLIQVFLNGVLLNPGDDYAGASNAVTLVSAAAVGDSLTVVAFASFNMANTYTIAEVDALVAVAVAGGTGYKDIFLLMGA